MPAEGQVFRFLRRSTAEAKDFLAHWDLYPQHREQWQVSGKCCEVRGLSVYRTAQDALAKRAALPALKKMKLAVGALDPLSDTIARTPRSDDDNHHTWWSTQSPDTLSTLFAIVENT